MAIIHLASIREPKTHIGTVYTMTVSQSRDIEEFRYNGVALFNPTKEIVFGHKSYNGDERFARWPKVNDEEYKDRYREILKSRYPLIKEWYRSLTDEDKLTLCCYCNRGNFCHRWFVELTLLNLNKRMYLTHEIHLF